MLLSEHQFEQMIGRLKSRAAARESLVALLDEGHPVYAQRAASAVARMRGWILLALGELGVTERELVFVLEELDTGREPYLVAAAAVALRSYAHLGEPLRPHLNRAQANIRYRDDSLRLDRYGGYANEAPFSTAGTELAETLRLLDARVAASSSAKPPAAECCCGSRAARETGSEKDDVKVPALPATRFQDHNGASLEFAEFFVGRPSIVVFFYTRCSNPQKCSLTMTKFARIGELLRARGLDADIRTAAITYDPQFDDADRLRQYAESRGARLDENHRVLRPVDGFEALQGFIGAGVNFVGSIVNWHRVELHVLDRHGRVARSFQRVLWDEKDVIEAAVRELGRPPSSSPPPGPPDVPAQKPRKAVARVVGSPVSALLGSTFSVAAAFFPKCVMCWTAYLSAFGVAGLERIGYAPWLLPVFIALMLANLYALYPRGGSRRRRTAFGVAVAGALTILIPGILFEMPYAPLVGVMLTAVGSFLAVGFAETNRADDCPSSLQERSDSFC